MEPREGEAVGLQRDVGQWDCAVGALCSEKGQLLGWGEWGGTERVNLAAATLRPGEVTSGLGAWREASGGGL